jgi:hypothetical protein
MEMPKQRIICVFRLGCYHFYTLQKKKMIQMFLNAIFLTIQTTSSKLASKNEWQDPLCHLTKVSILDKVSLLKHLVLAKILV